MNNPFAQMIANFQIRQNQVNLNRARRHQIAEQHEWNIRNQQIRNLNAALEPGWRNRFPNGEPARWNRNRPPRPVLNIELDEGQPILQIDGSNHIGVLRLNLKRQFPNGNSFDLAEFVDGEELVRLNHDNRFVFKKESLQNWFNMRKRTNPLSVQPVTQADIELFTYQEDLTLGGRRKGKKSRKNKKSRKSRNNKKSRKSRKKMLY